MEFSFDAAEEERKKIHNRSGAVGWTSAGDSLSEPQTSQHIIKAGNTSSCCLEKQLQESQRDKDSMQLCRVHWVKLLRSLKRRAASDRWRWRGLWEQPAAAARHPVSLSAGRRSPPHTCSPSTDEGGHSSHTPHFLFGSALGVKQWRD